MTDEAEADRGASAPDGRVPAGFAIAALVGAVATLGPVLSGAASRPADRIEAAIAAGLAIAAAAAIALLARRLRLSAADNGRLRDLVTTDPLTGLGNRRNFDDALERAWRDASRQGAELSLVLLDADHFKAFNDAYGHLEGDRALRAIAKVLALSVRRPKDGAFRVGGEEFAMILPDTDAAGAAVIAASVRAGIAALPTRHPDGVGGRFTLSMGIAQAAPSRFDADRQVLFGAADRALYRAKRDGRDRIRVTAVVSSKRPTERVDDSAAIGGFEILLPSGRSLAISDRISVATLRSVLEVLKAE